MSTQYGIGSGILIHTIQVWIARLLLLTFNVKELKHRDFKASNE